MQRIGTNIRRYLQKLRTPGFTAGAASAILAALLWEAVSQAGQSSLNHQIVGFYLMAVIALICLILVTYSLMRIQKLVENRNYTRFITSKPERLNLMTECIKNAKRSIYILSDLSGTEETQMEEHAKYIDALNQVMEDKKGNTDFEVKRIVVPPYASGMNTETNPDWIYKIPITEAYREHFRRLYEFDETALKHTNGPRNVSVILIDNEYLFWKPELTYGDKALDTLLDGGLYLEDYTREGIADFSKSFLIMHGRARWSDPDQFDSTKPKIE
jgi:hypothetical protein